MHAGVRVGLHWYKCGNISGEVEEVRTFPSAREMLVALTCPALLPEEPDDLNHCEALYHGIGTAYTGPMVAYRFKKGSVQLQRSSKAQQTTTETAGTAGARAATSASTAEISEHTPAHKQESFAVEPAWLQQVPSWAKNDPGWEAALRRAELAEAEAEAETSQSPAADGLIPVAAADKHADLIERCVLCLRHGLQCPFWI